MAPKNTKTPATTLAGQFAAVTGGGTNSPTGRPGAVKVPLPAQYGPGGYESYTTSQFGTPTTPNFNWTPGANTPFTNYFSQTPTNMASAWGLPANGGYLQVTSGFGGTQQATAKAQSTIDRGVAMIQLYNAFQEGRALTPAEMKAAQSLGGTVARAAEMLGTGSGRGADTYGTGPAPGPIGPARKGSAVTKAVIAGSKELAQRLEGTLHLSAADLTKAGLKTKVPQQLANIMSNAGYTGVTSQMTLGQALSLASGPKAEAPGTTVNTPQTIAQYIRSLTNGQMTAKAIYALQSALWTGGFYGDEYTSGQKGFTPGNLTTATISAFRSALVTTGQENAKGKKVTLAQVIQTGATQNASLLQSIGNAQKLSATPFSYATPQQLQGTLESAMASYLGRSPTQGELKQFSSYLDTLEKQGSKQVQTAASPMGLVDYSTGVPFLPKVPTPAQAAETWVQNTDPTAYHAHGIANAFGELMNLIDRQSVSAYTTVGTRPTTTS